MDVDDSQRSELAAGLLRARERAGHTQLRLGELVRLSQSQISHAEKGRRLLTADQVAAIAQACGCDEAETKRLVELVIAVRTEHVDARAILQRGAVTFQERVRKLERSAGLVREFQPAMVTGVCQTGEYARVIFAQRAGRPSDETEELVEHRVARGRTLALEESRRWEIVHTEGALGWCLGGPEIMAAQCEHLAEMSRLPHVRIGIVPAGRPVQFTVMHGFSIYDRRAVQVGTISATALLEDERDIEDHAAKFQRVMGEAVFDEQARELLARVGERYRDAASGRA